MRIEAKLVRCPLTVIMLCLLMQCLMASKSHPAANDLRGATADLFKQYLPAGPCQTIIKTLLDGYSEKGPRSTISYWLCCGTNNPGSSLSGVDVWLSMLGGSICDQNASSISRVMSLLDPWRTPLTPNCSRDYVSLHSFRNASRWIKAYTK